MKCIRCGKKISPEEHEENDGYCNKCWKLLKLKITGKEKTSIFEKTYEAI